VPAPLRAMANCLADAGAIHAGDTRERCGFFDSLIGVFTRAFTQVLRERTNTNKKNPVDVIAKRLVALGFENFGRG